MTLEKISAQVFMQLNLTGALSVNGCLPLKISFGVGHDEDCY